MHRTLITFIGLSLLLLSCWTHAACYGRIPNPVTDICWSCLFPITIGTNTTLQSRLPDMKTDASALCYCRHGAGITAGLNIGFFEPIRTIEIVREPFCFPGLGGSVLAKTDFAPAHGRTADALKHRRRTSFYQVHWYHTPWLYLLELLLDTRCLEQSPWDLAYLTELDPLWDDSQSSFLLNPDVALFSNPAAIAACAADCVSASVATASDNLYWCGGCAGSLFPLTGWVNVHVTTLQAMSLITQRFTLKMHREGVLWANWGKAGQCSAYLQPMMSKSAYRSQMLYPARSVQEDACMPFGRSTSLTAPGKSSPIYGEDGSYLIWRRRDCCQGADLLNE